MIAWGRCATCDGTLPTSEAFKVDSPFLLRSGSISPKAACRSQSWFAYFASPAISFSNEAIVSGMRSFLLNGVERKRSTVLLNICGSS
jgi:hypothetical protein